MIDGRFSTNSNDHISQQWHTCFWGQLSFTIRRHCHVSWWWSAHKLIRSYTIKWARWQDRIFVEHRYVCHCAKIYTSCNTLYSCHTRIQNSNKRNVSMPKFSRLNLLDSINISLKASVCWSWRWKKHLLHSITTRAYVNVNHATGFADVRSCRPIISFRACFSICLTCLLVILPKIL